MMKTKVKSVWKLNDNVELMEGINYFFMVRFNEDKNKIKVTNGGPWTFSNIT